MRFSLGSKGVVALCLLLGFSHAQAWDYSSSWDCDRENRFLWYCHKPPEEQPPDTSPPIQADNPSEGTQALKELERIQQDLKEKRAVAILQPSIENIVAYIEAQERMMDRASLFSDVWRRVLWQNPSLDYSLRNPINNTAIDMQRSFRNVALNDTMAAIAKDWGLFFFFRSDCPYCHKLAPVLSDLSGQYGITVFPISLDGVGIPEYPNPAVDHKGLITQLGISQVPALVLGNVRDRRMIPIGTGLISRQDIIERIYVLTQTRPGDSF